MALSNIFNEPRREITESLVGILVCGFFVWLDYLFAVWFAGHVGTNYNGVDIVMGMFLGIIALMCGVGVLTLVLAGTHAIGDGICNVLQRRGIYLRPRQRYNNGYPTYKE